MNAATPVSFLRLLGQSAKIMPVGLEDVDEFLDPTIEIPTDAMSDLSDMLPKGYLSVSQASTFLQCAHKWELLYIKNIPRKASLRMMEGVNVHRAAETALRGKMEGKGKLPPLDEVLDSFNDAFERSKKMIDDWEGTEQGTAKDNGANMVRIHYRDAAPIATPVEVEQQFILQVASDDGKFHLPVLGRLDSIQTQTMTPEEYERVLAGEMKRPLKIDDLKVCSDKWSEKDLENDLQFGTYSHAKGIPDITVTQIVKGRAKVVRPRYEKLEGVITRKHAEHSIEVLQGVAKSIGLGHFPMTDPSNWWCSKQWCGAWDHCRGK